MIRAYKGTRPTIHPSVFVEASAQVIGDVEIGEGSSVWFNAVIRGDVHTIRIGQRTNIQDGCLLHVTRTTFPLAVGDDVTVGHGAILHGCTVKARCLIGMGAIILDGAEIGDDSIIGAGALVPEGKTIPPRSLAVGAPARVVRALSEEELTRTRQAAVHYVKDAEVYKARR